jgi:hypothetical protein
MGTFICEQTGGNSVTDKPQPIEKGTETQSPKGDKAPADSAITSKESNRIQQLQERRDALGTRRLTQDPSNGLRIHLGGGQYTEDPRPFQGGSAEQVYRSAGFGDANSAVGKPTAESPQTQDTDYKPQKLNDHTFSLGVNRHEATEIKTPSEQLQDFMQAAVRRATDPEGWKSWAQSEINKFSGIGAGLNDAKEETKAAVSAGLKAMTDGTVIEFLSQPNAINAPVFKTVANAFEAMSKDPEAINKAFETLGRIVMKASEGYEKLPDYEKGKVIGKVMFSMINPEGGIKDAEAALKIGDTIATHVDKAVWDTAAQAMKAAEQAAKTSPEIAKQTKLMLYEYLKNKGLTGPELEYAGIPTGYFDGLKPTEAAAKDNYFAMSKADDLGGERLPRKSGEASGDALSETQHQIDRHTGRPQRTDLGKLREAYNWNTINEQFAPDAIRQKLDYSCISAAGEMLTQGRLSESALVEKLGAPSDIAKLPKELGEGWTSEKRRFRSLAEIGEHGPWAAEMIEMGLPKKPPHVVVVDGVNAAGNVVIRDPLEGTKYEMTAKHFLEVWSGKAVYRTKI